MKNAFLLSFLFMAQALADVPATPKLFFEYSWLYDKHCSVTPERKIDPDWVNEVKAKQPEFEKIWNRAEPTLFGKVYELFGTGFQRKEMTATLSVCPIPSYSNPLVLNVTRYLKSFMGANPVRSENSFADLVFHELLHTWLVENLNVPTPLLMKYKQEEPGVRAHLHLIAMQIYVYTELKRPDLIAMIEAQYNQLPVDSYTRAWEIVSKIEGHEAFISEIKRN